MSLYLQRILSRPYHSTNPIKVFKLPFSFIPHTLIDNHTHILRHVHHTCVHNNCNDDIVHNMSCLCHLKVTGRAWAGHGAVCSSADGSQVTRVVARPRSCVANMSIVSPTQPSGYLPLVGTIQTLKHTLRSNPATSGHGTRARQAANCARARVTSTVPGLGRNIGRGEQGYDIRLSSQ